MASKTHEIWNIHFIEQIIDTMADGVFTLDNNGRVTSWNHSMERISGYAAEITPDGAILLRPRVEVAAERAATLILSDADRDAFLEALADPPEPNDLLRSAAKRHKRRKKEKALSLGRRSKVDRKLETGNLKLEGMGWGTRSS